MLATLHNLTLLIHEKYRSKQKPTAATKIWIQTVTAALDILADDDVHADITVVGRFLCNQFAPFDNDDEDTDCPTEPSSMDMLLPIHCLGLFHAKFDASFYPLVFTELGKTAMYLSELTTMARHSPFSTAMFNDRVVYADSLTTTTAIQLAVMAPRQSPAFFDWLAQVYPSFAEVDRHGNYALLNALTYGKCAHGLVSILRTVKKRTLMQDPECGFAHNNLMAFHLCNRGYFADQPRMLLALINALPFVADTEHEEEYCILHRLCAGLQEPSMVPVIYCILNIAPQSAFRNVLQYDGCCAVHLSLIHI
jgi:hypothetical protein